MTIPFVVGSETSEAAARAKRSTEPSDMQLVYEAISKCGVTGATDDEIEERLGLRHQNASARRNALVKNGLVRNSGLMRRTRSGRAATVWVAGKGEAIVGARNDRVKRPNDADLVAAACELARRSMAVEPGLSMKLNDVALWLRAISKVSS